MHGLSAALARSSARIEATLTTHAFLYLSLVAYAITSSLFFVAGFRSEWYNEKNRNDLKVAISLARGAGYALNFNTPLLLLLASRLFHTLLRLTPFATMLPLDHFFPRLHILVAYVVGACLLVHIPAHFVWIIGWNKWKWGLWQVNMTVITGILLTILFVIFMVFSRPYFRTKFFRTFRLLHIISAALFYPILVLHGMYRFRPETYKFVAPAMFIYILDRIVRRLALRSHAVSTTLNPADSAFLNASVLRLRLPRSFNFRPGQYAEVRVPALGREWHPFTIASAPHDDHLTFYIKDLGDWTHALHNAVRKRLSVADPEAGLGDGHAQEALKPLRIAVRGPFGAPAQQFDQYSRIILVSGGIGATPFASICRHINHLSKRYGIDNRTAAKKKGFADDDESSVVSSMNSASSYVLGDSPRRPDPTRDADMRLRAAVAELFDIDVAAPDPYGEVERRGNQVAELLRLEARRSYGALPNLPEMDEPPSRATFCEPPSRERVVDPNPARSADAAVTLNLAWLDDTASSVTRWTRPSFNMGHQPASMSSAASVTKPKPVRKVDKDADINGRLPNASFFDAPRRTSSRRLAHRKIAGIDQWLASLLQFLHTTRVSFVLLLLLLARAGVLAAGSIIGSDFLYAGKYNAIEGVNPKGWWVVITQVVLYAPVVVTMLLTTILELKFVGVGAVLGSTRRLGEAILFGPLSVAALAWEIRRTVTGNVGGEVEMLVRYVVVLPLTMLVLCARMWRSIGRRGLLLNAKEEDLDDMEAIVRKRGDKRVPGVDFVWTTPKFEDDRWLRAELGELAGGSALRLHRFATREKKKDMSSNRSDTDTNDDEEEVDVPGWRTNTGRPDWEKMLGQVAMEVGSDEVVGIFFCGPHAMGKSVREAAKKMEMWSNLKGAYLRTASDDTIMDELGVRSRRTIEEMRRKGCRVRFVYSEENFN